MARLPTKVLKRMPGDWHWPLTHFLTTTTRCAAKGWDFFAMC